MKVTFYALPGCDGTSRTGWHGKLFAKSQERIRWCFKSIPSSVHCWANSTGIDLFGTLKFLFDLNTKISRRKWLYILCDLLKDGVFIWVTYVFQQEELANKSSGLGQVHGNVRCRNIMVCRPASESGIRVKLGDPGLIHMYNGQKIDHPVNHER